MIGLPKYKSHKVVRAAKIIDIQNLSQSPADVFEAGYSLIEAL